MPVITTMVKATKQAKAERPIDKDTPLRYTAKDSKGDLARITKVVDSYIRNYENEFVVEEVDPRRYFFLRPSSFPYCGFKKLLRAHQDIDAPRLNTLSSTYFTEVGHTTHAVFQAFGALGGKIVGDWECKACGAWRKFSTRNTCPDCGKDMFYHELEIKYKGVVLGHMDGIFRLDPKLGRDSVHIVVDYKTTGSKRIADHKSLVKRGKPTKFPYQSNVHQIEAYVPLAEIQYNIKISYWLLIYLARDAPFNYGRVLTGKYLNAEDKTKIKKRIDRWIKTHKMVLHAQSTKEFKAVEERKLCKSLEDYQANYADQYNPCPFVHECFTNSSKLIAKARTYKVYPIIDHAPKSIKRQLEADLGN